MRVLVRSAEAAEKRRIMYVNVRAKAPVEHFTIAFSDRKTSWEDGNKPLFARSKLTMIKEEDQ